MTYSTACSKSWTDVNVDFKRGTVGHCCKSVYYDLPNEYTSNFFTNSEHIQKRRQDTLNGIQHPDCQTCWKDIKNGVTPFKDWMNEWKNFDSVKIDEPQVNYIEVDLDNTCDLSCLYCSADASSKIAQEEGIKGIDKTRQKDIENFTYWLKNTVNNSKSHIDIAFLGGEPTASKLFYELIDYIVTLDTSNVTIQITTNCNSKAHLFKKLLNAMDKCQCDWQINISNESYKDDSALIRYGLDWDRFEQNLCSYASHKKVRYISFDATMTSLAIPTFTRYIQWVLDTMANYTKKFGIIGDAVFWPGELDVAILPESFKPHMDSAIQLVKENRLSNYENKKTTLTFLEGIKTRIGSNYKEDYTNTVAQFLVPKQKYKKTDKLMRLVDSLGEIK
jgi:organic radical activating enzyme